MADQISFSAGAVMNRQKADEQAPKKDRQREPEGPEPGS
jgi:hypothetical protein